MPLGTDDQSTRDAVEARRKANAAARPNDGIEAASFTPFAPATTAWEALGNAEHGFTPDGDLLWSPAAPGQAQAFLDRALDGESGVAVRLRTVRTTDVAIPVVIGSFEDAQAELDDCRCLPYNALDDDLSPDGKRPLPKGRFAAAKDPYAVTLLMLGCGWVRTAAQIAYGKPSVDLGLALPTLRLKHATGDALSALGALLPFVPQPGETLDEKSEAIRVAVHSLDAATRELTGNLVTLDVRMHNPARLKGGAFTVSADTWGLDATQSGTAMACSFTLDEAFALWQSEKAKKAGTPNAGAGGFSEAAPSSSGGGLKG